MGALIFSFLKILPKNALSRLVGRLVTLPLPGPLRGWSIRLFASLYHIQLHEAEKPVEEYASIGDFFVRRLKDGARPVGNGPYVHPADARITQVETLQGGDRAWVKGQFQSVAQLLANDQFGLGDDPEFAQGTFLTYYLCPTDYHRVHSPVRGRIEEVRHIPGQLWPVNERSVREIPGLFAVNERVAIRLQSAWGPVWVILVGATNVGKITLAFDSGIVSNRSGVLKPLRKHYSPALPQELGQELGQFNMGSTVVVVLGRQAPDWSHFKSLRGTASRVGQPGLKSE